MGDVRALLALCLPLWACTVSGQEYGQGNTSLPRGGEVLDDGLQVERVIDGDTIEVTIGNTVRSVRLKGIDTPELYPKPAGSDPEPWAVEARNFAISHVGSTVALTFETSCSEAPLEQCVDFYNRLLAYVTTAGGEDLGAQLLEQGLALVYQFQGEEFDRLSQYTQLEELAQQAQIGVWSE